MKLQRSICILAMTTMLFSCGTPKPEYIQKDVDVAMDPFFAENENPYELKFHYEDQYFLSSAKTYDKNLAMLSFGSALASWDKTRGDAFFTATGFKDIQSKDYDITPTANTAAYYLGHKDLGDAELIAVSFRGFEYGMEWADNFLIGKTGDHKGFSARAKEAYEAIQVYKEKHFPKKDIKMWISGYSRGGALSNVLASLIMRGDKLPVKPENLFVYTFEAPGALDTPNAIAYENVHNLINYHDLIPYVPPQSYGLKRCGVDVPIYDDKVADLLKAFDPKIELPDFVEIDTGDEKPLSNDVEVIDFCLQKVFNNPDMDEETAANTREQYVDNYQADLSACIGYVFAMKEETRTEMLDALMELGFGVLALLGDQTGAELMNFVKPYFDKDGVAYQEDTLQGQCATLVKAVGNLFLAILLLYAQENYRPDLVRMIDMHYPEVCYVLIKNSLNK